MDRAYYSGIIAERRATSIGCLTRPYPANLCPLSGWVESAGFGENLAGQAEATGPCNARLIDVLQTYLEVRVNRTDVSHIGRRIVHEEAPSEAVQTCEPAN
jgi:hypothetical protein